jgi:CRISPR-associated endonuclease Cas3-HD
MEWRHETSMKFFAHTAEGDQGNRLPEGKWQALSEHLRNVARLARAFATPLGLADEAELAGLLHDLGKYAERFQARLRNPAIHGINHWAAGAVRASAMNAWTVAFAVDGHHTGIPALNDNTAGLPLRQTVAQFNSHQTRSELTGQCPESLDELLDRLAKDNLKVPSLPARPIVEPFAEALRTRMLFSCLVDADFLDTEQHFNAAQAGLRVIPELRPEQALAALQRDLQAKSPGGAVNALRRELLRDCLAAAEKPPGLFTLTAPTGSGKTLSSLAFALKHIARHNSALPLGDWRRFRRVVVVIPFTNIIELDSSTFMQPFPAQEYRRSHSGPS